MLSTTEPRRHTPAWRTGDDAPVYLLRAGSVIERATLEAELSGEHGAGRVFSFELLEAFREGVTTLLADDPDHAQLLDLAASEAGGEELASDEARLLEQAREVLAMHWPAYRALTARMARRKEVAPILALRRFLVGWENVAVPFAVGADSMVPLATIGALDPMEMLSAGNSAFSLLYPDAETEGNSARRSSSDSAPETSPSSDGSTAKAGRSGMRGGKKTRSTPSRR